MFIKEEDTVVTVVVVVDDEASVAVVEFVFVFVVVVVVVGIRGVEAVLAHVQCGNFACLSFVVLNFLKKQTNIIYIISL